MAAFDEAIDPMIRECAMEEFLEKGFTNASLRNICAQAGVTTGALYNRYGSKEELFQALVQATIDDIDEVIASKSVDYSLMTDGQLYDMWTLTEKYMDWWFGFMIDHRGGFTLLVKCSGGSRYQDFQHELVEKVCQETYKCYRAAADRGLARGDITPRELHVLTTAFWSTMFEPFVHGFTDEEIRLHCQLTIQFIDWHRALGFRERNA
ncbi:TetR/AcrR family transcriptional regulator [Olsenella urininfantis]|uniref:TetR/AcrR family transcriptional regulator n=1 Tax=Olsenella urininfantis TaxID=1871033 RepID=UPI0013564F47|nr:TetR/AcrR family transcriptional regulator [Olsenella urininfantis]